MLEDLEQTLSLPGGGKHGRWRQERSLERAPARFAGGALRLVLPSLYGPGFAVRLTMQVGRGAVGLRAAQASLSAVCGARESARAPVVCGRRRGRSPAVTG